MRCSKCGAENPVRAKFCEECASPLARRCPSCQTENSPTAKFCIECAKPLEGAGDKSQRVPNAGTRIKVNAGTDSLDGERKVVTFLFADIKGSMDLMEDLDPEEARAIVDPALKLMMEAVHHYGGYVAQPTGDGIFALFGAPVAHEDHPRRALFAALRLQEEMRRYSTKLRVAGNLPVEARVGVNTGEVVVRSITTGQGNVEYAPIGHSTGLAARMQALAPTGSIATTDAVRKLCEGYFLFNSLGPTKVKGVSEPVNVYEVRGLGPLRTRLQRAAARGYTTFVGRDGEMEALRRAAEQAKAGHGQIVAVMAEPGVGKSRLFFEFKATSQSGWMLLEAVSFSHGQASAYLPVLDLLHSYFGIESGDDTRTRREKVNGKVLTLDRTLEDALPHLFGLLGLAEGGDPLAATDSQIRRRRTHEALKRVLLRETLNQPLIVVFEDLHWIDEETQAFLNLFVDSIGTARLLLLVNYRPEYSHPWNSKTYYTQLRLDRLGRESADEMLDALLGVSAQAMDKPLTALKHLIIEKTDGNPLFMEELVEALFEQGMLVRDGAVKLARPVSQLKIPSNVQGILAARIDRLPAEEKELLQTLAVIGMEFPISLAREVAQQPLDLVDTFLNNLQTAEFIHERPSSADVEYTFKHPLTRQIADESLLNERRKLLHQRVGQAIESLYAENLEDHYSELARHFLLGNDPVKALVYTRPAIEQLVSRFAYSQAANFIDAGLRLVGSLPDDRARLEAELWLRAVESMVDFALFTASSPQRERAIRRMYELSEQLGDQKQLLRAKINLSNLYFVQGESARGLDLARQCLPLAEAAEDDTLIADAHWSVAGPAHTCGALAEAVAEYDKAILCSDRVGAGVSLLGVLLNVAPLSQSCVPRHLLGRINEAAALAEQGIKRARESGHLFTLGQSLTSASLWMAYLRREPDAMLVRAEEQIALFSEHGQPEWLNWGHIHKGMALADLGHVADGVLEMEKGIAGFGPGGAPILQFIVAVLALGYARLGRIDEAIGSLNEVLAHVERSGEKAYLPEIMRLKGEVILKRDPSATKDAEGCFRDSLEVARAQSARWWQLRTTISLAKLLRSTGRTAEARTMLADIYNWFTEGFDTADLKDAKALLDELNN